MPAEKRKPLDGGYSLLDSMRARLSRLAAKKPMSRKPVRETEQKLRGLPRKQAPQQSFAQALAAAAHTECRTEVPTAHHSRVRDRIAATAAGTAVHDRVRDRNDDAEAAKEVSNATCGQPHCNSESVADLSEGPIGNHQYCSLAKRKEPDGHRLPGLKRESERYDASSTSVTSAPAAEVPVMLDAVPLTNQQQFLGAGRMKQLQGAARDPRLAERRADAVDRSVSSLHRPIEQPTRQENSRAKHTAVPAVSSLLKPLLPELAARSSNFSPSFEPSSFLPGNEAVRTRRDPRHLSSAMPQQQLPAQLPAQRLQPLAERIWPPLLVGRVIPEHLCERLHPNNERGYSNGDRFAMRSAVPRYEGMPTFQDWRSQLYTDPMDIDRPSHPPPMYTEQYDLDPHGQAHNTQTRRPATPYYNLPVLRGRPLSQDSRIFSASFRQPVYDGHVVSTHDSAAPHNFLAHGSNTAQSNIRNRGLNLFSGESYGGMGGEPVHNSQVDQGRPSVWDTEPPLRQLPHGFQQTEQHLARASAAQQQLDSTGRSILGWTRQNLTNLANTKRGKLRVVNPEAEAMGRAAADLGFMPAAPKRQRVQKPSKIAPAAHGPWNDQSLRAPASSNASQGRSPTPTLPARHNSSGFRVLSVPSASGPIPLAERRRAPWLDADLNPRAAPRLLFRDFSQPIVNQQPRMDIRPVDEAEEESTRSDESSAQTVACGPSPGHDRFSNGAILANQQRGFPSVRDGQHAEASDMHESDPEECSRTRSVLKRKANAAQRGWNGKLLLSREFEAAAAFLAKKQTFKPVKLKVTRTKRQAHIANLHTAWKQSRLKLHRFVVRPSRIAGLGVYSTEDIEEGELLMEYGGEIIRRTVADMREKQGSSNGIYFFALSNELVIDATHAGGIARFINHCCEPNCWAKEVAVDGMLRILILAAKKINAGDELTYDYCLSEAEEGRHMEMKIKCICGSQQCRGNL